MCVCTDTCVCVCVCRHTCDCLSVCVDIRSLNLSMCVYVCMCVCVYRFYTHPKPGKDGMWSRKLAVDSSSEACTSVKSDLVSRQKRPGIEV
jgi:hypothetical protein